MGNGERQNGVNHIHSFDRSCTTVARRPAPIVTPDSNYAQRPLATARSSARLRHPLRLHACGLARLGQNDTARIRVGAPHRDRDAHVDDRLDETVLPLSVYPEGCAAAAVERGVRRGHAARAADGPQVPIIEVPQALWAEKPMPARDGQVRQHRCGTDGSRTGQRKPMDIRFLVNAPAADKSQSNDATNRLHS